MTKYSRFENPRPTANIYFYEFHTEEGRAKAECKSQEPTANLNRLIRDESVPHFCCSCGQSSIRYEGMGAYKCRDCGTLMYNSYGKVKQCLDLVGAMPEGQLMEETGLSKKEIRRLLETGALVRSSQGLHVI